MLALWPCGSDSVSSRTLLSEYYTECGRTAVLKSELVCSRRCKSTITARAACAAPYLENQGSACSQPQSLDQSGAAMFWPLNVRSNVIMASRLNAYAKSSVRNAVWVYLRGRRHFRREMSRFIRCNWDGTTGIISWPWRSTFDSNIKLAVGC